MSQLIFYPFFLAAYCELGKINLVSGDNYFSPLKNKVNTHFTCTYIFLGELCRQAAHQTTKRKFAYFDLSLILLEIGGGESTGLLQASLDEKTYKCENII